MEDPEGSIPINEILGKFSDISAKAVTNCLKKLFPFTIKKRIRIHGKREYIYTGISLTQKENLGNEESTCTSWNTLESLLRSKVNCITFPIKDGLHFSLPSCLFINNEIIMKTVKIENGQWQLTIKNKLIDLSTLGISDKFVYPSIRGLENILTIVGKIEICRGIQISECVSHNSLTTIEKLKEGSSGEERDVLRSNHCKQVVPWGSRTLVCLRCQTHSRLNVDHACARDEEEEVVLSEEDSAILGDLLKKSFKNCSQDMQLLIQSQEEALKVHPNGRRWRRELISLCLSLWVRSPQNYATLKESNMLILPSGRQLRRYKNKVPQDGGIHQEIFEWMHKAAKDAQIPSNGWCGGLIHDETKIQQNLVMQMKGGTPELIGWVDTGEEGNSLRTIRFGKIEQTIATQVIQVTFLGYTGFRFPLCHYPTCGVKSSELHVILWKLVACLNDWGFTVDYINQDGGKENRTFIKSNFEPGKEIDSKYLAVNLVDPSRVIAMCQDFSHNIKKIRNGILKSGDSSGIHTRKLKLGNQYIVWKYWIDAVKWDREVNSRTLGYNITDTHLYPNCPEKMRNHLAEEMLDADFLFLMKNYQASLTDGSFLNATIELLEITSKIISIFRDTRPVKEVSDERLIILKDCSDWFSNWRAMNTENGKEILKSLLSQECLDDVQSMLITFPEVCRIHLKDFPHGGVVPSRFNTDIIENSFCQVRGLYNGSNTNPSYADYCKTVNSMILGQPLKSRGRNSNVGILSAKPFSFYAN